MPNGIESSSMLKPKTQYEVNPATQVCWYLLETFSAPLLCSHATISLIDYDRLQLYHANCLVILVSSAINFSGGDGLSKFVTLIITLSCFSLKQNGISDTLMNENPNLVKGDIKLVKDHKPW